MKNDSLQKEKDRILNMFEYEKKYYNKNIIRIAGVDEAGRGPLAGPVVAAAVILPKFCEILYLDDSKKLSEKKRELLFDEINEKAIAVGIGIIDSKEIDKINIEAATKKAMLNAVSFVQPDAVLIDGNRPPKTGVLQEAIIRGDEKSLSIAAASVIAKVTRDRLMREYGKLFPEYEFPRHKGYGTKLHIAAIGMYGICSIHRKTFIKSKWLQPKG